MKHPESVLQMLCVSWFYSQYPKHLIYSIPNGVRLTTSRAGAREKRMGMLAGMPDLSIPFRNDSYFGLFVEMKVAGNYLSDLQAERRQFLLNQGYCVVVCWKFEDFESAIRAYMKNDAHFLEEHIRVVDEMLEAKANRKLKKRTKILPKIKERKASHGTSKSYVNQY